jgi:hypothetical protein
MTYIVADFLPAGRCWFRSRFPGHAVAGLLYLRVNQRSRSEDGDEYPPRPLESEEKVGQVCYHTFGGFSAPQCTEASDGNAYHSGGQRH